MKRGITELFCFVDDFYKTMKNEMENHQICNKEKPKMLTRIPGLTNSEIMTIMLMFQESPCRNFKYFYKSFLQLYRPEFPQIPSYSPELWIT
jgi:hypothetical protein